MRIKVIFDTETLLLTNEYPSNWLNGELKACIYKQSVPLEIPPVIKPRRILKTVPKETVASLLVFHRLPLLCISNEPGENAVPSSKYMATKSVGSIEEEFVTNHC